MLQLNIIKKSVRHLLFLTLFSLGLSISTIAQEVPTIPADIDDPNVETDSPTSGNSSIFSIEGGDRLLAEAEQAIENQNFDLAVEKLQSARQVFNQLSNFYLQLFNSFSGLDNAAAESHRTKALDTSIKRDEATYQLALVHRSQNKSELSIPLLIQIITSQSPGIGLGKKAYEQLLEIGFVDTPYTPPQPGTSQPETSTPEGTAPAPQSTPDSANPETNP